MVVSFHVGVGTKPKSSIEITQTPHYWAISPPANFNKSNNYYRFFVFLWVNLHINWELPIYSVIYRTAKEKEHLKEFSSFSPLSICPSLPLSVFPTFTFCHLHWFYDGKIKISKLPYRLLNSWRTVIYIYFMLAISTLVVDF